MGEPGRDHVGVGVGAVVADGRGHLFLAQRGPAARNEVGRREFPGGGVEFGETLEHAAVREMAEEYGLRIEIYGLLGVFDHILLAERQHWVSATYLARRVDGMAEIREPAKCAAIGWFPFDGMPAPLSEITEQNLVAWRADPARAAAFLDWTRHA